MVTISVAFVDDHPILLEGLVTIFSHEERFKVVATGRSASEAVDVLNSGKVDMILIDLNMPGDAFEAISRIRQLSPATQVVAFTASSGIDHAVRALEAGAAGYVLKGSTDEELMRAIDTVMAGGTFITPSFAGKVISALRNTSAQSSDTRKVNLSVREDQIVRLLLLGRTNKEIALRLRISEKTVKRYMTVLMQKLQARNRVEVVLAVQEMGGYTGDRTGNGPRGGLLN